MSKKQRGFNAFRNVFFIVKNTINYYWKSINQFLKRKNNKISIFKWGEARLLILKIQNLQNKYNSESKILDQEIECFIDYNPELRASESKWIITLNKLIDVNNKYNNEMGYLNEFLDNYELITKRLHSFTNSKKYTNDFVVIKKLKKVMSMNYGLKNQKGYYLLSIISAYNYLNTNKGKLFFNKIMNEYIKKVIQKGESKKIAIIKLIESDLIESNKKQIIEFKTPNYVEVFSELKSVLRYKA